MSRRVLGLKVFSLLLLAAGAACLAQHDQAQIGELQGNKDGLSLKGEGLGRVEIWAAPSGTGTYEQKYATATLSGSRGKEQLWSYLFSKREQYGLMVTVIYARGWTRDGHFAGKRYLMCGSTKCTGVSDIDDRLFGSTIK